MTEVKVLFSTAAAVPLPRTSTVRRLADLAGALAVATHATFRSLVRESRPAPRPYPRRHEPSYMQGARMAREMDRL